MVRSAAPQPGDGASPERHILATSGGFQPDPDQPYRIQPGPLVRYALALAAGRAPGRPLRLCYLGTATGDDVARALRGALQTVGAHVPQMPALIRPATPATAPSPERGTDAESDEGSPPPEAPAVTLDAAPFFDAWGSPVVFLPRQHPKIGMSAGDRPFFVSPGPDRRYLTREDNLYSYEEDLE